MDLWLVLGAGTVGVLTALPLVRVAEGALRTRRPFSLPARWGASLGTGVLFAGVALSFGVSWVSPAYLYFAAAAVVLSLTDLAEKRLPNAIIYPSMMVMLALLTCAALLTDTWSALLGALAGSISLFVLYSTLRLISPGGIGMGDVKLAAVIGLALGYLGLYPVLLGCAAGFIFGGLASAAALWRGSATLSGSIPFGPAMLSGAFVGVFLS